MSVLDLILYHIEEGTSLDELATGLCMRRSVLVAMIGFMVRKGYLQEVHGSDRNTRTTKGTCIVPMPGGGREWSKLYRITENGRRRLIHVQSMHEHGIRAIWCYSHRLITD